MELSPQIIDWCKQEALGQVLTSWEYPDGVLIQYETVLELLEAEDLDYLLVWQPFEDQSPEWIADQIESVYKSYIACAKHSKGN